MNGNALWACRPSHAMGKTESVDRAENSFEFLDVFSGMTSLLSHSATRS